MNIGQNVLFSSWEAKAGMAHSTYGFKLWVAKLYETLLICAIP